MPQPELKVMNLPDIQTSMGVLRAVDESAPQRPRKRGRTRGTKSAFMGGTLDRRRDEVSHKLAPLHREPLAVLRGRAFGSAARGADAPRP
jgi:hypothetical protein